MTGDVMHPQDSSQDEQKLIRLATVVYVLQAVGLLLPVSLIVGVIIDYVKLPDTSGNWIESHFRWQIRTFWVVLVLVIVGVLTFLLVVGYFVLIGTCIWLIYRIIKGWLFLNDRKPLVP